MVLALISLNLIINISLIIGNPNSSIYFKITFDFWTSPIYIYLYFIIATSVLIKHWKYMQIAQTKKRKKKYLQDQNYTVIFRLKVIMFQCPVVCDDFIADFLFYIIIIENFKELFRDLWKVCYVHSSNIFYYFYVMMI